MATTYESGYAYIETATSIKAKIACIDAIIAALDEKASQSIENEDVSEYWLDDGQTKIKTVFRSSLDIERAIKGYEQRRFRLLNRLNGHSVQLIDKNSNR